MSRPTADIGGQDSRWRWWWGSSHWARSNWGQAPV